VLIARRSEIPASPWRAAASEHASAEFPLGRGVVSVSGPQRRRRGRAHQVLSAPSIIGMLAVGERDACSLFCAMPRGGEETLQGCGWMPLKRGIAALCHGRILLGQIPTSTDTLACRQFTRSVPCGNGTRHG